MGLGKFIINSFFKLSSLRCPFCNYKFQVQDFELSSNPEILICPKCSKLVYNELLQNYISGSFDKTKINPSPRVKVSEVDNKFIVVVKPGRADYFQWSPVVIFFFFTALVLSYLFISLFFANQKTPAEAYILIFVILLFCLTVTLLTIRYALNWTVISVDSEKITISGKPIPPFSCPTYRRSNIANFSIAKQVIKMSGDINNTIRTFVNINLKDGSCEKLLTVYDLNEAAYIEKLLEDRLGLIDCPTLDQV